MYNFDVKMVVVKKETHTKMKNFCDKYGFKYIFVATKAVEKYIDEYEAKYSSLKEV